MNQKEIDEEFNEIEEELEGSSLESRFNVFRREVKSQFLNLHILLWIILVISLIALIILIKILLKVRYL